MISYWISHNMCLWHRVVFQQLVEDHTAHDVQLKSSDCSKAVQTYRNISYKCLSRTNLQTGIWLVEYVYIRE